MFSPEEQQIEICLLKLNLEEIENDLVAQRSAIPALDAENEKKYHETMAALRVARSLNYEVERLKQDSVRLTAKRMQLKRQCEEVAEALERARRNHSELQDSLKQEERDVELEIRRYEDKLRELADRFRQSRAFYDEEEVKKEMEIAEEINHKLEDEEKRLQNDVSELNNLLSGLHTAVPENILSLIGQKDLENELASLSAKSESLRRQRDYLLKNQSSTAVMFTQIN